MAGFINYNGKIIDGAAAFIPASDHSYRYGDGLFETMKIARGSILYREYHFDRLFSGLDLLKFRYAKVFTRQRLTDEIAALCEKNNCTALARVRLSVSRGNGGLYDCDERCSYLIECWPLEPNGLNENGLVVDIYPSSRKSIDAFSNLKSANYLSYVMGAIWAKENQLNDALIVNSEGRICDATIANLFWIKTGQIFTPPLSEGCVAGVMRRRIIDFSRDSQLGQINEMALTETILLEADEVFLTNVTSTLRWVKQIRDKAYSNKLASKLFAELVRTI